ncbi:hypothetical protein [Pantoea brenneri]|uniref:hypothetical protein n=1 Tax=Pantoea brenneri TaxID=472694 RepID=UPI00289B15B0|nr:hypothetical protein [Pantoea brenneri]
MVYILAEIVTKHIKQQLIFNLSASGPGYNRFSAGHNRITAIPKYRPVFSSLLASEARQLLFSQQIQQVNREFDLNISHHY